MEEVFSEKAVLRNIGGKSITRAKVSFLIKFEKETLTQVFSLWILWEISKNTFSVFLHQSDS